MGNPAGVLRMKREKRRAKFEKRLGAVAYVPKELQEDVRKAVAEFDAADKAAKIVRVEKAKVRIAAGKAASAAAKAAAAAPPPA